MRMVRARGCRRAVGWLLSLAVVAGCGLLADDGDGRDAARRSEVLLSADPGWEGAVEIDSLRWLPAMPLERPDPGTEQLEGTFAARFVNTAARRVQVRYELRFLDEDAVLLDAFFPFGQPVVLDSTQTRRVSGEFRLDLLSTQVELLATMVLAARVTAPEP
jgi:hypothetical protein